VKKPWCLPEASAAFVARMADRLARSEEPDDPQRLRICFDERPCQWLADRRAPLPLVQGYPARVAYEYTRHGTYNRFIMVEPFPGGGLSP
jgi:hypothetical protein